MAPRHTRKGAYDMLIGGLPDQELTGTPSHEACAIPENRLMLAVLQEALATFQKGINTRVAKEIEAYREVDRWFRSRDYDWPFSFESICSSLLIDPACVREGLNRLRRKALLNRSAIRTIKAPYRSSRWTAAPSIHLPTPQPSSSRRQPAEARVPPRRPPATSTGHGL